MIVRFKILTFAVDYQTKDGIFDPLFVPPHRGGDIEGVGDREIGKCFTTKCTLMLSQRDKTQVLTKNDKSVDTHG